MSLFTSLHSRGLEVLAPIKLKGPGVVIAMATCVVAVVPFLLQAIQLALWAVLGAAFCAFCAGAGVGAFIRAEFMSVVHGPLVSALDASGSKRAEECVKLDEKFQELVELIEKKKRLAQQPPPPKEEKEEVLAPVGEESE